MLRKPFIFTTIISFVSFIFVLSHSPRAEAGEKIQNPDNGHWYQRFDNSVTWNEAEDYCRISGAHLATISTLEEDLFVFDNFVFPSWMPWLGGTDEGDEGNWRWVTGEPIIGGTSYTNWDGNEPNNCCPPFICGGTECTPEHYLVYSGTQTFSWNDIPNGGHPFVCEWDDLNVSIDIKPGSDPNCFNIDDHGVIPVAINGSGEFSVYDIDVETLSFGGLVVRIRGNRGPLCSIEDWNEDGHLDMVCHFEDDPDYWVEGGGSATLTGTLLNGTPFEGTDSICVVP